MVAFAIKNTVESSISGDFVKDFEGRCGGIS